ncbi:hypothetical protein E1166_28845 [Micromonospora sp. KC213]|nr:hypothetical protein E1166_28845 [Micromonospora sp. KC213]
MFVDVGEGGQPALSVLLRAAPTHGDATERLQGVFDRQFLPVFRAAYPDQPDIDQRAALVFSQTIGMAYCRYLLRLEPLASMDKNAVHQAIAGVIRHFLTEPIAGPASDSM